MCHQQASSNSPSPGALADKVQSKEAKDDWHVLLLVLALFYCAGGEETRALSQNYIPTPNSQSDLEEPMFINLSPESTGNTEDNSKKKQQEKGLTSSSTAEMGQCF